ncbi:MAG: hypothetical protein IH998_15785 [Proteobacteria bacterium]|nr:hypothetical protein [Pseudomonadota bacterium]
MKIAIRLECLGLDIRKAIETAARLGAGGVQFDAVAEFLSLAQKQRAWAALAGRPAGSLAMSLSTKDTMG